jgi:hypothetical protein
MMHALRFAVVVLALAVTGGVARADDLIWGSAYQNPWSSWDAYSYKRVESKAQETIANARHEDAQAGQAAPVKHRPLSATDFKRKGGRPALDEYMATTGLTGADADNLRGWIETTLAAFEGEIRKDNVASSMAALLAAATYATSGTELDDATEDALVANLNDTLASDRAFKKLKAKDRQRMADTMLIQAAVIAVLIAQDDPAIQETGRTAATQALQVLTGQ